jgi:hypothetical protein
MCQSDFVGFSEMKRVYVCSVDWFCLRGDLEPFGFISDMGSMSI